MAVKELAQKNLKDEKQAVRGYGRAVRVAKRGGNLHAASKFAEIQREERHHAEELTKMAKETKSDKKVASAFHEVYNKVPENVKKTGKTGEAKRKMMTAIALSKARAAGAKIPKRGGNTPIAADSMKYEGLEGRKCNLKHKAEFKSGPQADRE